MTKEKITVTGATGNIGSRVVDGLIAKGLVPRVVVQQKVPNKQWEDAGVDQVEANMADRSSLEKAFEGSGKSFLLTPLVENFPELSRNMIEAAKNAGVNYIVRSSAGGADPNASIKLPRWHGEAEKDVKASGIDFTIVRAGAFAQNYLGFADSIKNQNAFYQPIGDARVAWAGLNDIAAVAIAAVTENTHSGKTYTATGGESLSGEEVAAIFTDVLARKISYINITDEHAEQYMRGIGLPGWLINALTELNAFTRAGNIAAVDPAVEQVTGRKPTAFRQFVEKTRSAFE
jgi:uncharacterized protein YbjT (DUF2867 family)